MRYVFVLIVPALASYALASLYMDAIRPWFLIPIVQDEPIGKCVVVDKLWLERYTVFPQLHIIWRWDCESGPVSPRAYWRGETKNKGVVAAGDFTLAFHAVKGIPMQSSSMVVNLSWSAEAVVVTIADGVKP